MVKMKHKILLLLHYFTGNLHPISYPNMNYYLHLFRDENYKNDISEKNHKNELRRLVRNEKRENQFRKEC